jgi:hypothetical protein
MDSMSTSKDIIIDYRNDTYATINADRGILMEISEHFSFYIDNYQFNPKYKAGLWDGMIRIFSYKEGLPLGLIGKLIEFAEEREYTWQNNVDLRTKLSDESIEKWLASHPVYSGNDLLTLHKEQLDSIKYCLQNSRGIIALPTSAGKSLVISLISKYFLEHNPDKVLILVPTTQLVDQFIKNMIEYRLFKKDDLLGIYSGVDKDLNNHSYNKIKITLVDNKVIEFNELDKVKLLNGKTKYAKDLKESDDILF